MKVHGIERLRQAAWRVKNWLTPKVLILLYHRVIELSSDPYLLGVTPQRFAEHLEVLRKHGRPMRLQQLVQALRDGNLPRRAVVVTFDDGYADNLYNAKPLLERHDTPATVFVTTCSVGRGREFWWDELARLFLQPGTLPEALHLNVGGNTSHWKLGEATTYSENECRRHRDWHYGKDNEPSLRHRLFRSLYQKLVPLSEGERRHVLEALLAWAGTDSTVRPAHRPLSPDEVVRLAEGGLIEVGAHTVTHPALPSLPIAAQRDEVHGSKTQLEEIVGRAVTSFSYPYGDYTAETAAIVQEAGFGSACSASDGIVRRGSDRFQLPRVGIRDWDGDEFDRRLWTFFHQ
jgi:peptidoglycan/xylan/chitin deacetylase (PgdA/CDA1 family)